MSSVSTHSPATQAMLAKKRRTALRRAELRQQRALADPEAQRQRDLKKLEQQRVRRAKGQAGVPYKNQQTTRDFLLTPYRQRVAPQRLEAETVSLTLDIPSKNEAGEDFIAHHALDVSLAYGADGRLREMAFVGRGKVGHGLDLLLHDLGIKLSRAIQGRNPDTGGLVE